MPPAKNNPRSRVFEWGTEAVNGLTGGETENLNVSNGLAEFACSPLPAREQIWLPDETRCQPQGSPVVSANGKRVNSVGLRSAVLPSPRPPCGPLACRHRTHLTSVFSTLRRDPAEAVTRTVVPGCKQSACFGQQPQAVPPERGPFQPQPSRFK